MAKGYVSTVDRLTAIVRDVVPSYDSDHTFVCVEDGDGVANDLEAPGMPTRSFDLRLDGLPADAGYTGPNGRWMRALVVLRVRYRLDVDRGRTERAMATDVALITQALLDCCLWDSDSTGINTLIPPEPGSIVTERIEEQDAMVVSYPIEVEYLEGV